MVVIQLLNNGLLNIQQKGLNITMANTLTKEKVDTFVNNVKRSTTASFVNVDTYYLLIDYYDRINTRIKIYYIKKANCKGKCFYEIINNDGNKLGSLSIYQKGKIDTDKLIIQLQKVF